ncbi:MAG: ABC transporter ATP-binding protein [Acidimicrobiales bacterium]
MTATPNGPGPGAPPPLLAVNGLDCGYGVLSGLGVFARRRPEVVVRDISFTVAPREVVALVGESGSGKTTIARAIAGLPAATRGEILFEGRDIAVPADRRPKQVRREIQFVFQNPDASLNPRRRVGSILGRPLTFFFGLSGRAREARIEELLTDVHLDPRYARRFPGQLSGGERQRVAIAQALAAEPKLILCDEIVSALDVSVQASILDLLREVQAKRDVAYLFIAHDLAVVRWLAHRVLVLYRGHVMEAGTAEEVFSPPFDPYTETLLRSVPEPGADRSLAAPDERPEASDLDTPTGCPFSPRCPHHLGPICDREMPPRQLIGSTHSILCHIPPAELATRQADLGDPGGGRPGVDEPSPIRLAER